MTPEQISLRLATRQRPLRAQAACAERSVPVSPRIRLRARAAERALAFAAPGRLRLVLMGRAPASFAWRRPPGLTLQAAAPFPRSSVWFQIWLALSAKNRPSEPGASPGTLERVLHTRQLRSTLLETAALVEQRLHRRVLTLRSTLETRTGVTHRLLRRSARSELPHTERAASLSHGTPPVSLTGRGAARRVPPSNEPAELVPLRRTLPLAAPQSDRERHFASEPPSAVRSQQSAFERLAARAEPPLDVDRLADRVIRALDQRMLALRERMGRV